MSNLGSRLLSVLSRNRRLVGIITVSGLAVSAGLYLITRGAQTTAATTDATQIGNLNGDNNINEKEEEEEEEEEEDLNNEEDEEENIAKLDDDNDDDETRNDQTMIVRVNTSTMTRPQVIALVSLYANTVMCYVFAVMAAIEARRELPHFAVPVAWTGVGALVGILVQFFRRQSERERIARVRDRPEQERRQQQQITQENDEIEEEEEEKVDNNVERVISTRKKSPIKMGPSLSSTSPTPRIIERPVTAPTPVALSSAAPARRLEFSTASDAQQMIKFPIESPSSFSFPSLSSSHRNLEDEEPQPPSVHRPSPSLHKKQQESPKSKR